MIYNYVSARYDIGDIRCMQDLPGSNQYIDIDEIDQAEWISESLVIQKSILAKRMIFQYQRKSNPAYTSRV